MRGDIDDLRQRAAEKSGRAIEDLPEFDVEREDGTTRIVPQEPIIFDRGSQKRRLERVEHYESNNMVAVFEGGREG